MFIIIIFSFRCDRPSGLICFVPMHFISFHTHASPLTIFVCFFIVFHSWCFHSRVFGKTLVHEFQISYTHTEWFLLFSRGEIVLAWPKLRLSKSNHTTTIHTSRCSIMIDFTPHVYIHMQIFFIRRLVPNSNLIGLNFHQDVDACVCRVIYYM